MVEQWLVTGMFKGKKDGKRLAKAIVKELGTHSLTLSHARHISLEKAQELGLDVLALEADNEMQDAVLSVHHACIQTISSTSTYKLVENQTGMAFISQLQTLLMQHP